MWRHARVPIVVATCGMLVLTLLAAPASEEEDLHAALKAYFEATDPSEKQNLVTKIRNAADGSVAKVADVLANFTLWPAIDGSREAFAVDIGGGVRTEIVVTLPQPYDPARAYPLLLALSEPIGTLPSDIVVAQIADAQYAGFNAPRRFAEAPRRWLHALRRRYHLDADRVYLYGSGLGGDAAFAVAVMHCDAFAGVSIHEGTLMVPYWRELHPLLLANLRNTPLHLAWTRPELPPHTVLQGRAVEVALMNQSVAAVAERESLPITTTVLASRGIHPARTSAWDESHVSPEALRSNRVADESRQFRYPAHGRTRIVNIRRFSAPIWEGDQLDIMTSAVTDRRAYVTRVLESKLHSLSVKIEGQAIDIECPHCESIEIRLSLGDVDFAKPVQIRFNGKRRFSDRLTPSIETLLDSADASWDFQHPACVRLRIGSKGSLIPF